MKIDLETLIKFLSYTTIPVPINIYQSPHSPWKIIIDGYNQEKVIYNIQTSMVEVASNEWECFLRSFLGENGAANFKLFYKDYLNDKDTIVTETHTTG